MRNILVVEDEPDIAEFVRYNLVAKGLRVTIVPDGAPALRELQTGQFDLVLLDLMLPVVAGEEVCKAIRRDSRLFGLPVLVMSARGDDDSRRVVMSLGADGYLVKPFRPSDLCERVQKLLHREPDRPELSSERLPQRI
jgi:DNA-binding response OmpR family regulator